MSAYKEIPFLSNIPSNTSSFLSQTSPYFSSTLSLKNHFIIAYASSTSISIQTLNTKASSHANQTSSFILDNFPSPIIKQLTLLPMSNVSYLLIVFTENAVAKVYEIDINEGNQCYETSFEFNSSNLDSKLTYVELLSTNPQLVFSIGSERGSIYLCNLNYDSNMKNMQLTVSVCYQTQTLLENVIAIVSIGKENNERKMIMNGINCMKCIGNGLLCIIRNSFVFEVYDFQTEKVIYSNKEKESNGYMKLISSGIIAEEINYDNNASSGISNEKIYRIVIYMNYSNNKSDIITKEIWFMNIQNACGGGDGSLFSFNDIRIKNERQFNIDGIVVDMLSADNNVIYVSKMNNNALQYEIHSIFYDNTQHHNNLLNNNTQDNIDFLSTYSSTISTFIDYIELRYSNLLRKIDIITSNLGNSPTTINKLLFSIISSTDEFIPNETLINLINNKYNKQFSNKKQTLKFLNEIFISTESNLRLDEEIILPSIYYQINNNNIISLAQIENEDLKTIIINRKQSFSIFKKVFNYELIDIYIDKYEYELLNIISTSANKENDIKHFIHKEVNINECNAMFLIMSLIRLYLNEMFLLLNNETFLYEYFKDKETNNFDFNNGALTSLIQQDDFINKIFIDHISVQLNNSVYFSNEFIQFEIYTLYINHNNIIDNMICSLKNNYQQYNIKATQNSNVFENINNNNHNNNFFILNSIYCDIISKVTSNRINSMFKIFRDFLGFVQWRKNYFQLSDYNVIECKIKEIFNKVFSCFLVSNHLTYFNMDNVSKINIGENVKYKDKEVTILEFLIFEKISHYGTNILTVKKNEVVNDFIYFFICDVLYLKETNYQIYSILFRNNDIQLIHLINNIHNNEHNMQVIFIALISNAIEKNYDKIKKLLSLYFLQVNNENTVNSFEKFYAQMNFDNVANINQIHLPQIKAYLYLELIIRKYLPKEQLYQFYYFTFPYVFPSFANNIDIYSTNNNTTFINFACNYIANVFESVINLNPAFSIKLYAMLNQPHFHTLLKLSKDFIINSYITEFKQCSHNSNKKTIIDDLISNQYDLLESICDELTNRCTLNLKNNDLVSSINNMSLAVNENFNYFKLLIFIYTKMKQYKKCAIICYDYAQSIYKAILTDQYELTEMIEMFREHIHALNNCLISLNKANNYNNHNSSNEISYLNVHEITREKKFSECKLNMFIFYNDNYAMLNQITNEDEIMLIKENNKLLNGIFQYKMYDLVIKIELVKYLRFPEAKIFIYNIIRNLLNDKSFKLLELFITQIIKGKFNHEFIFVLLEVMLLHDCEFKMKEICDELIQINKLRTIELLLKYGRSDYIYDIIENVNLHSDEIPEYLIENIYKYINTNIVYDDMVIDDNNEVHENRTTIHIDRDLSITNGNRKIKEYFQINGIK
jgi:hypothetical protein